MQAMESEAGVEKKSNNKRSKEMASENKGQKFKLAVDFKDDETLFQQFQEWLEKANQKKYGRKIEAVDVLRQMMQKMNDADLQQIQESTYSKMDKVYLAHEDYNAKHGMNFTLEEYLIKELKLQ